MVNFLNVSSPAAYAESLTTQESGQDARLRDEAAYRSLIDQYGPQAGDPTTTAQVQANALNAQLAPLKVQDATLDTDQKQRADQAWQATQVVQYLKKQMASGQSAQDALGTLNPTVYSSLGVDPAHVAPLAQLIQQDPTTLDKIAAQLAPDAGKSKMLGTQPLWAEGKDGTRVPIYPMRDDAGNVTYQQGTGLPAGFTFVSSPDKQVAQDAAAAKAAAGLAETTDLNGEGGAAALQALFPGVKITGLGRTADRNAQVGGATNSMHLPDKAVDFVLPEGVTAAQAKAALIAHGYPITEFLDEPANAATGQGAHVHWGFAPKPTAAQKNAASGAGGGLLNPDELSKAVDFLHSGGTMTQLGVPSGQAGAAQRAQLLKAQMDDAIARGDSGAALVASKAHGAAVTQYQRGLDNLSINSPGGQRKAFDAIAGHADVADQLIDALHNGNQAQINAAKNAWQKSFGSPAPTNLQLAFTALAGETAKAVANNTSVFDQKEYLQSLPVNGSVQQQHQAIQTIRDLARTQLGALRTQASAADSLPYFDAGLSPAAKNLVGAGQPSVAQPGQSAGGWKIVGVH